MFPGGSHLVLGLADGTSLSLQIIKPFLPFTKSQFFLVCPGHSNGLPSELILKVYDPCYLDDRIPPPKSNLPSRLWTLKAETEAAHYRQEIAEGKRPDDFTVNLLYGDEEAEPYISWLGLHYDGSFFFPFLIVLTFICNYIHYVYLYI